MPTDADRAGSLSIAIVVPGFAWDLNVIREAVAPGVPNPAKGTDTDSAARDH